MLWALWHLPLFFIPASGSDGQSFPIYLLLVTSLSIAMGWLYWKTDGSLLLVMLMHASVNNTTDIVPAAVPGASDPFSLTASSIALLTLGLSWLVAVLLLSQMRGAQLAADGRDD
jgi:membrane protease YdiL (CAAX protease family)